VLLFFLYVQYAAWQKEFREHNHDVDLIKMILYETSLNNLIISSLDFYAPPHPLLLPQSKLCAREEHTSMENKHIC
jgi:hypothetical protein